MTEADEPDGKAEALTRRAVDEQSRRRDELGSALHRAADAGARRGPAPDIAPDRSRLGRTSLSA